MIDPVPWEEAIPRLQAVDGYRNRLPFEDLLDRVESRSLSYFQDPTQA